MHAVAIKKYSKPCFGAKRVHKRNNAESKTISDQFIIERLHCTAKSLNTDDDVFVELANLESLCFSTPWTREEFAHATEQDVFYLFAAWKKQNDAKNTLVAYLAVYFVAGEVEILNIATHPHYRRLGIAQKLFDALRSFAQSQAATRVLLEVREHNVPAITLYEKEGFVRVGMRKKYYEDTGENALVYELHLTC